MPDPTTTPAAAVDTGQMSDQYPVLLGPVRIETRFTPTHLLVRVFPDDWSVEAQEPLPSSAELSSARRYWVRLWQAGGDRAGQLAAWRTLVAGVGVGRAAWILDRYQPRNPHEQPLHVPRGAAVQVVLAGQDRPPAADARAHVAVLDLPSADEVDTAPASWTRAARARLLPDRFVVLGYKDGQQVLTHIGEPVPDSLAVTPDPSAAPEDQLRVDGATLHVPEDLRWLTEFDRAVALGMGMRIELNEQTKDRIDRLLVIGLRQKSGPDTARSELETLISRQHHSSVGFSLLPQGTPTNNSERAAAAVDGRDEVEAGFQAVVQRRSLAVSAADWQGKTDGQWLAELLGIDPAVLHGVPHADGTDQREARAANLALWPATWGYFLRTMLHPLLSDETVEQTREFFTRHVSGRGTVPSIRVGRQPYGILPTTAFSRLAWPQEATHPWRLHTLLNAVAVDWALLASGVAHLGSKLDDPAGVYQLTLDILGLHPTSTEFHQRYAQSVEDRYNRRQLRQQGPQVTAALEQLGLPGDLRDLLTRLGYDPSAPDPEAARRLWLSQQHELRGPLVDDLPASETRPLQPVTADEQDYLRWLSQHGRTSLDTLRTESGFAADHPPAALLYLLLRHALLLGWEDTALRLAVAAGSLDQPALEAHRGEPPFIHVSGQAPSSESRFARLYAPDPAVTGDPAKLVADHIADVMGPEVNGGHPATSGLADQLAAIQLLHDVPTARLERVLAEHLDCCTYRMDAWRLGLVNQRLFELRYGPDGQPPRQGLHLGAYGWLEDLRPRGTPLIPVTLTGELAEVFTPPGSSPLLRDPANGGWIHAPSLNHAATAAVLRAGYLADASTKNPGTLAVNLSSQRIRTARTVLEGIRAGQPLGALLGYQLERGLHDRPDLPTAGDFVSGLRRAFPLRAGRLSQPAPGEPGTPSESVAAHDVIDGLALIRRVTRTTNPDQRTYPFGLSGLPPADDDQKGAIKKEVDRLLDVHDALADLALAESVHQMTLGNNEQAAATLDAFAKSGLPPEPAVTETPRSGVTVTHRLGLQFRSGLLPIHSPGPGFATPRSRAEPAVNDWLARLLPHPTDVGCLVTWVEPASGAQRQTVVTWQDLRVQPIDLLWLLRPEQPAAMTDLDDRIIGHVLDDEHPPPDATLTIRYTEPIPDTVTFFQLSSLITALRTLLGTSRALRPSDLLPPAAGEAIAPGLDDTMALDRDRPASVRTELAELGESVAELIDDLAPLLEGPEPDRAELLEDVDDLLTILADLHLRAGGFGMARSGWSELAVWRQAISSEILAAVAEVAARMAANLAAADELIEAEDDLPGNTPAEERFRLLQQAELHLTTSPTSPRPDKLSKFRSILDDRRDDFQRRLEDLQELPGGDRSTLSELLDDVDKLLPLSQFDATGLDLAPFQDRVVTFCADLLARARSLDTDLATRLATVTDALADYDAAPDGPVRLVAGTAAIRAALGEDALVVPEFTLPEQLADQWRDALREGERGHLTDHLERDFPVDDWLHGLARVRDKARLWEQVTLLTGALGGNGPELVPAQMPFQDGDPWLGLEFPASHTIDRDPLLYTAHYATFSFPFLGDQCGLLLDEWTEVIPAAQETTGIAAHFDRPGSEPPQTMLLLTPPQATGAWAWDDVVAAVNETLDLAKARAVEPSHVDGTAYAQLLPAVALATTRQPITIGTDLARNKPGGPA